jgi:hypothetical protein
MQLSFSVDATPDTLSEALPSVRAAAVVRFIARWWIGVGSFIVLITVTVAIAHYTSGTPMIDADTGQPAPEIQVAGTLLFLFIAGLLSVVVGFARLKRLRR